MLKIIRISVILFVIIFLAYSSRSFAGPPFKTDDPQPVDFSHWEFYVSSDMEFVHKDVSATCPHFEINYGVVPDVQIHLLAPFGYVKTESGKAYGYMDTEVGVKYRFININDDFMVGIFPLAELPTGNQNKQLGNGTTQLYFPLWIQKSWGKFTTYGGAGYWYNPGTDNKNYSFVGWEGQYDFSSTFTLGGEIFYQTADTKVGTSSSGFNIGGYINLNEENHILFSAGQSFSGTKTFTGYFGYQMTI